MKTLVMGLLVIGTCGLLAGCKTDETGVEKPVPEPPSKPMDHPAH